MAPPSSLKDTPVRSGRIHKPAPKPPQSAPRPSNQNTPMAPGSNVWPATMKMTTKKGRPSRQPQPQSAQNATSTHQASTTTISAPKPLKRDGVGTRSNTIIAGELNDYEPITELSPYQRLMNRKNQLRRDGTIDQAGRIQAAVNVGMMLGWNESEVVRIVGRMEEYVGGADKGWKQRGRLMREMMEVGGEEEILGFERNVREGDDAWVRMRFLRRAFGPRVDTPTDGVGVSGSGPGFGAPVQTEREVKLFAPLLLIKIQAALDVAFHCTWEARYLNFDANDNDLDTSSRSEPKAFDMASFKQKATYLLRVPNKQCGNAIFHLLRRSKLGRKRFGDTDRYGRAIAAMSGIERLLMWQEKAKLLDRVKSLGDGKEMVRVAVGVLGCDETVQQMENTSGRVEGPLNRVAMAELSDEGFMVLDGMYRNRRGVGILGSDYVVDGEEEEDVESVDDDDNDDWLLSARAGGFDGVDDAMEVDAMKKGVSLKINLRVEDPA